METTHIMCCAEEGADCCISAGSLIRHLWKSPGQWACHDSCLHCVHITIRESDLGWTSTNFTDYLKCTCSKLIWYKVKLKINRTAVSVNLNDNSHLTHYTMFINNDCYSFHKIHATSLLTEWCLVFLLLLPLFLLVNMSSFNDFTWRGPQ